jgi:hypothetical protein
MANGATYVSNEQTKINYLYLLLFICKNIKNILFILFIL